MKGRINYISTLLIIGLLFFCGDMFAQRLIQGQSEISVSVARGIRSGDLTGGTFTGVEYGKVDSFGKIILGINYGIDKKRCDVDVEGVDFNSYYDLRNNDIYAGVGYLASLVSNRSRSVVLWGGATALAGIRWYYPKEDADPLFGDLDVDAELDDVRNANFIYGIVPQMRIEFFPARAFSISTFFKGRLQFYQFKDKKTFYPEFGFSFGFYFL